MQVSGPIDGSAPQAGINDTEKDLGLLGDGRFEEIEVIDNDFEADDSVERPEDKHDKHAEAQTGSNALELSMGNSEQWSDHRSDIEAILTNANTNSNSSVAAMESKGKALLRPDLFEDGLAHRAVRQGRDAKALSFGSSLQSSSQGSNDTTKDSGLLGHARFQETEAIDKDFEADNSVARPEDKYNKKANALELSMGNSEQWSDHRSDIETILTNANTNSNSS
eukprot:CAMPEP_0172385974 /NCGR_PEP_ID=MMETSP1061-20121228/3580_1 /TAXON_ID=37318 /ORGANISM="Pseudo-nitzschia pungens, Strain cf. pungens" /LENGTH=222 /DNA_ID=CAMNT_0013115187 /DNA_START=567 /DNA_END=1232 /DNA_ORIENTATION=-